MFWKKGQVTIFMILGIFLIVVAFAGSYLTSTAAENIVGREDSVEISHETAAGNFIQACLKDNTDLALRMIFAQSGQYQFEDIKNQPMLYRIAKPIAKNENPPHYEISTADSYVYNAAAVQTSLGVASREFFVDCINTMTLIDPTIEFGSAQFSTTVTDTATRVALDFPVTMTVGDSQKEFSRFEYVVPLDFAKIRNIVSTAVTNAVANNGADYDYLDSLGNPYTSTLYRVDGNAELEYIQMEVDGRIIGWTIQYDWP